MGSLEVLNCRAAWEHGMLCDLATWLKVISLSGRTNGCTSTTDVFGETWERIGPHLIVL